MDQEEVGDVAELLEGLLVPVGYGLVGVVAAGHHERDAGVAQEQVVQRGVGEHDAQSVLARGHVFGHVAALPALQEHYGAGRRGEKLLLFRVLSAQLAHLFEIPGHEREGLVLAHLAATQGPHRPLVERVAGEVVASESLDGDDGPPAQHPGRPQDGVFRFRVQLVAEPVQQPYPRAADGTGVGLGVEAAVGGVVVLALAFGAHRRSGTSWSWPGRRGPSGLW